MFQRGRIYLCNIQGLTDRKYLVVVSNNVRNAQLKTALALRVTSQPKPALPSIVEIPRVGEPLTGRILCDDIYEIWPEDVVQDFGEFSATTMARVSLGLKSALDIP